MKLNFDPIPNLPVETKLHNIITKLPRYDGRWDDLRTLWAAHSKDSGGKATVKPESSLKRFLNALVGRSV